MTKWLIRLELKLRRWQLARAEKAVIATQGDQELYFRRVITRNVWRREVELLEWHLDMEKS